MSSGKIHSRTGERERETECRRGGSCSDKAVEGSQALRLITELSAGRVWAVWVPGGNLSQVEGPRVPRSGSVGSGTRVAASPSFPILLALLWEHFCRLAE